MSKTRTIELTTPQAAALHTLLSIIMNDPEFAEAAAMTKREWTSLERVADKVVEIQ